MVGVCVEGGGGDGWQLCGVDGIKEVRLDDLEGLVGVPGSRPGWPHLASHGQPSSHWCAWIAPGRLGSSTEERGVVGADETIPVGNDECPPVVLDGGGAVSRRMVDGGVSYGD